MSYQCEKCKNTPPNGTPSVRVVTETREVEHPFRSRANRDGSRWDNDDGETWTQVVIVVSAANVLRRLKLDLMYGELVEPK